MSAEVVALPVRSNQAPPSDSADALLRFAIAQESAADRIADGISAYDILRFAKMNRRRARGVVIEGDTTLADQRTALATMLGRAQQDVATFAELVELAERVEVGS